MLDSAHHNFVNAATLHSISRKLDWCLEHAVKVRVTGESIRNHFQQFSNLKQMPGRSYANNYTDFEHVIVLFNQVAKEEPQNHLALYVQATGES